ncbi:CheR family methyltransferase [Methanocella arvoryzae]|uniref:protein-glutamate O-methyltransferase n=1 Tax=Methanocella arvoryzae (strain DSM 22066 / NBRC 105507 / MRE50) TaxID=351160 RepID=Q0W7Y2_METAR|nr:protein-glutamate O-methyltransferase CheR [Methanocella arvoryzae]CAJ35511.1 chemotaxis MCP methyltransferase [Methanocella arvoryzae MRE50]
MQEISDPDLRLLIRRIKDRTGIDLSQYKDSYIYRRLSSRMKVFGAATYKDYLGILEKDSGEYEKVVDAFTINVSEFFRDREVFKVIMGQVMPDIIAEKKRTGRRNIRIWSAGCACGEEVYSLSMILNNLLGNDYDNFSIRLYATDIDEACMAKAREGYYDPISLKNVDRVLMAKYTTKTPDGRIRVTDEVRRNVTFKSYNLIKGGKFGSFFDLILCRNVMIYFSDDQKARLLMEFYNSLSPGGYLVIGRTETLVGDSRNLLQAINGMERVYRKPENGTAFFKPL